MKKFTKYVLLFFLPIFILCMTSEYLLRKIPNDYLLKREYLDKYSDSLKILFLGSSHAFFGINPTYFSSKCFNASHVSQTLEYDFEILKKYKDHWRNLECIAIPISYFSLFETLETSGEPWRVKNYTIYYGMNTSNKLKYYSEVLSNKFTINIWRIYSYYICGTSDISCSNLGWGLNYNSKNKRDLDKSGKEASKRHSTKDDKYFIENISTIKSIIGFANEKGVRVFFYTPPAYSTYIENLDSNRLNRIINTMTNIDKEYDNVRYQNFLLDSTFTNVDFFDADHLDEIGAKKFTYKIDSLINQN